MYPFLNLTPNTETMLFVLMAFANDGNYMGIERILNYFQDSGHTITTAVANYVLKSVIMNRKKGYDWDDFIVVYQKYFGPDGVPVDNETYIQIFLACQKYNREAEAIHLFDELIDSGLHIAPIVRNTFRLIMDNEEITYLHPDFRDEWEIEDSEISSKGADFQPNYQIIWANTPKTIKRANVPKRSSGAKKVAHDLVCGYDDVVPKKASYGGSVKAITANMEAREKEGTPIGASMIIAIITAYSAADDPESAFQIMKEKSLLGFKPDLSVYRAMIQAFAAAGNYEGAESVIAYYDQTGVKAGKGIEFSISFNAYVKCLEITPRQL